MEMKRVCGCCLPGRQNHTTCLYESGFALLILITDWQSPWKNEVIIALSICVLSSKLQCKHPSHSACGFLKSRTSLLQKLLIVWYAVPIFYISVSASWSVWDTNLSPELWLKSRYAGGAFLSKTRLKANLGTKDSDLFSLSLPWWPKVHLKYEINTTWNHLISAPKDWWWRHREKCQTAFIKGQVSKAFFTTRS